MAFHRNDGVDGIGHAQNAYIKSWLSQIDEGDQEHKALNAPTDGSTLERYAPRGAYLAQCVAERRQTKQQSSGITMSRPSGATGYNVFETEEGDLVRNGQATPDSLGLQAAFRLGRETLPHGTCASFQESKSKHKLGPLSDSSFLEPLTSCPDTQDPNIHLNSDEYKEERTNHNADDSRGETEDELPENRQNAWPEQGKMATKYERRARRKTRPDRYEAKPARLKKDRAQKSHIKPPKTKSSRTKRGAIRLPKFSSDYVATERLTLRPSYGPGMFNKGRASTPAHKPGLLSVPDLAFSEMRFLEISRGPRKALSDIPVARANVKRARKVQGPSSQDEMLTLFSLAQRAQRMERTESSNQPGNDASTESTKVSSLELPNQCSVRNSPVIMALGVTSSQPVTDASPTRRRDCRTPPLNADDRVALGEIMGPENSTPANGALSTPTCEEIMRPQATTPANGAPSAPLSEELTWPSSPPCLEPRMQCNVTKTPEPEPESSSTGQPLQEQTEPVNIMRGFWRPHKLY